MELIKKNEKPVIIATQGLLYYDADMNEFMFKNAKDMSVMTIYEKLFNMIKKASEKKEDYTIRKMFTEELQTKEKIDWINFNIQNVGLCIEDFGEIEYSGEVIETSIFNKQSESSFMLTHKNMRVSKMILIDELGNPKHVATNQYNTAVFGDLQMSSIFEMFSEHLIKITLLI